MKRNVCSSEALRGCTGCGVCAGVCNFDAIKMLKNQAGFYYPEINENLCTGCSLCTKVCYKFDDDFVVQEQEDYECYSAVNKSEAELQSASSGAVSVELMRECIKRGYYVVGVAYDCSSNSAVTKIAKKESELEQFKGSKYFQSYTEDAFKEIIMDRSGQKYAIFGTPCQIYAFSKISKLKDERDKYLLVDIFCHGCPSLNLWTKYLEDVKRKTNIDNFDNIKFRSKTHGWHEYCFDFVKDDCKFSSSKYNDSFCELFFGMDALNEACYDCVARSTVISTDIRIGDFWGARHDMDTKGVSAVVIASEEGKDLFSSVAHKFHIESAVFDEIVRGQSYKKIHKVNEVRRNSVLSMLAGDDNIDVVVKKRRKMLPLRVNVKRQVKSLLKHLPDSVYLRLKTKLR